MSSFTILTVYVAMPMLVSCNRTQSVGRPTALPSRGDQPTPKHYKPQSSVKKDFSAFITIAKGLAGVVKEIKKGVEYFTGMFKDIMEKKVTIETVESEEKWQYENTEKPVTVEEVTEPKIKITTNVLLGATPASHRIKMQEAKLAKMKTSSKGKHKIVKKNKRKSSLEPDYSPYITFARGLAMLFNQTRVFTSQISRQGSKLASKSQFPFKSDSSPFLAIIKGLAGTVNELKKGVKYIVQLVENQVDKNESGPESEEWFYENTETPDTVEYFTEVKRKRKPTIPMGVIPKSIRRVRRKRKLEKARMEKLKKRKIGKKKKRRKKKH